MSRYASLGSGESLESTLHITSVLLWLPHALSIFWLSLHSETDSHVHTMHFFCLLFLAVCTNILSTRVQHGDWLMAFSFLVGLVSELQGLGTSSDPTMYLSRRTWMVVSGFFGCVSGVLCKAKDLQEGRYFEGHAIGERLYMVMPFTIGLWTGYIVNNGWQGVFAVFSSIFVCLATVGYAVVIYRIMRYLGGFQGDLISLIDKIFTTSFGAVFSSMVIFVAFVVYLAVPFMSALLELNALVTAVGIITEVLVYDVA